MTILTGGSGNTHAKVHSLTSSKIVGPGAQAFKYDILTALLVTATCGDKVEARLALRLSLVITARFNWRTNQFSVGQAQLAQMWGVTERTAKREIAALRQIGWISIERPAARGRVSRYSIDLPALLRDTHQHWAAVGPDFSERMSNPHDGPPESPANVVPIRPVSVTVPAEDGSVWARVASDIHKHDPATYASWFSELIYVATEAERLIISAPNRFVANYVRTHFERRILSIASGHDRTICGVRIVAADED